jgi:hypothetical protein
MSAKFKRGRKSVDGVVQSDGKRLHVDVEPLSDEPQQAHEGTTGFSLPPDSVSPAAFSLSAAPSTRAAKAPSRVAKPSLVRLQRLLILGRATVTITSGEVLSCGALLSPDRGPVQVCGDPRIGGPIILEPAVPRTQLPLASAAVRLTVSGDDAQAWLDSDLEAPTAVPLPPDFLRIAAEVAASLAGGPPGAPPPLIVTCGGKKTGKSTFARLLVNTLLNIHPEVVFLDTDCGQPEFTPPGLVSLSLLSSPVLGPPHAHLLPRPEAAHFIGDTSPAADPLRYVACVADLHRWWRSDGGEEESRRRRRIYTTVGDGKEATRTAAAAGAAVEWKGPAPMVVNTHGWIRGAGLDLLGRMLGTLPATHVVRLEPLDPGRGLPPGAFWVAPDASPPLLWSLPQLPGLLDGEGGGDDGSGGPPCLAVDRVRPAVCDWYGSLCTATSRFFRPC